MKKDSLILIAEHDKRHFDLIRDNLLRAGVHNKMLYFANGQEILDFFFDMDKGIVKERNDQEYVLLLDVCLPGVDGVEVLEKIKQDKKLKKIVVIILTATDDQHTIERCYNLGCSTYILKPTEQQDFEETIQKLGCFLSFVETTSVK